MFNFKTPRAKQLGFALSMGLVIAAVNLAVSGQTPNRAVGNPSAPQTPKETEWRDWGGNPEGNHFLPLSQINKGNVTRLDVAWIYPYAQTTVNPLVAHGVIYTVARNKSIVASMSCSRARSTSAPAGPCSSSRSAASPSFTRRAMRRC